MNLEELIFAGLDYIGFEKPNDITVNLIIEVRKYLLQKSEQWYEEKFPEAYKYDIKERRKKLNDRSYGYDGIKYYFGNDIKLESCILHDDSTKEKQIFSPPLVLETCFSLRFSGVRRKAYYKYEYINEIDHFFTYCINKKWRDDNNQTSRKEFCAGEEGIVAIRDTIEKCKFKTVTRSY